MNSKVFIRNLPWAMTEADLSRHLGDLGFSFKSVRVILEQDTGRSRGFAFVEFSDEAEASRAIEALTGYIVDGRLLHASLARQQENKSRGGGSASGRRRDSGRPKFPERENRHRGGRSRSTSGGEPTDW